MVRDPGKASAFAYLLDVLPVCTVSLIQNSTPSLAEFANERAARPTEENVDG
jgi:hypothetical protein